MHKENEVAIHRNHRCRHVWCAIRHLLVRAQRHHMIALSGVRHRARQKRPPTALASCTGSRLVDACESRDVAGDDVWLCHESDARIMRVEYGVGGHDEGE